MSVYSSPMGMGVVNNPITDSPYVEQSDVGIPFPPIGAKYILTEGGIQITTESGKKLTTE